MLGRLSATSAALQSLRDVFAAEEPLKIVMERLAETAARAIRHADAISVTVVVVGDGDAKTCGHTDAWVLKLDRAQYASDRGPCLEAAERQQALRVDVPAAAERWPEFVEAAQESGVRACLSLPLIIDGADDERELGGSLNVYSYTASAFDAVDLELMQLFTVAAGQAIGNARRWQHSRETVMQLERALVSRTDIDQAKGVLRARYGYSAEEAFAELVNESQRRNLKLYDVARELIASLTNPTKVACPS